MFKPHQKTFLVQCQILNIMAAVYHTRSTAAFKNSLRLKLSRYYLMRLEKIVITLCDLKKRTGKKGIFSNRSTFS